MNVEMIRSWMLRIALQDGFQHADELESAGDGLSIGCPELPRTQHHEAFCKHDGCVQIVWILCGDFTHGVAVIEVKLFPVRLRIRRGIAPRESSNHIPLQ